MTWDDATVAEAIRDGAAACATSPTTPASKRACCWRTPSLTGRLIRDPDRRWNRAFNALLARRLRPNRSPISSAPGILEPGVRGLPRHADPPPRQRDPDRGRARRLRRPRRRRRGFSTSAPAPAACCSRCCTNSRPRSASASTSRRMPPALARRNAIRLGLADRAAFIAGDWTAALGGRFDWSSPTPLYRVRRYPRPDAGGRPARAAARTGRRSRRVHAYADHPARPARPLPPGGAAILELGAGQAAEVCALARQAGYAASLHLDLAGIQRAVVLSRTGD